MHSTPVLAQCKSCGEIRRCDRDCMKRDFDWKKVAVCASLAHGPTDPLAHTSPPSYLDEIHRVTAQKYIPTDGLSLSLIKCFELTGHCSADVLKARLKTMGVVEHTFHISSGSNRGVEWKIYDVGGARNQRQAWAPYFEDG